MLVPSVFVAVTTAGPALLAVTVTDASPEAFVFAVPAFNVPRVVENVIGEFATAALFFFQLTVTVTGDPSATSVFAAGAVKANASDETLTLMGALMPSALAVSVSTPLLFAVKLNDALPVASVKSGVCEMPLFFDEVIVTAVFAMPELPALVSTTLYLPVLPVGKEVGPLSASEVPTTFTVTEPVAVPLVALIVIARFVGSPAVLSVAFSKPLASVVAGCETASAPELDMNCTDWPSSTLLLASRTSAVIVALADPSDGICGLEVSSVSVAADPLPVLEPGPLVIVLSPLPLHAHSASAAAVNSQCFNVCIVPDPLS
jgi:hypothetical protein